MDTIFNMFDAVVIGLIILLSLKGLISGFTKELFSALGIIGGLFAATFFNKEVAQYIGSNFDLGINIKVLELISLIAIFIAIFIIMKVIYKIIASISSDDYISPTSRLGGMLIKMITLFFIFSLITFALSSKPQITEKFKDTLSSSKLYPLLKSTGATILNAPQLVNGSSNSSSLKDSNNTKSAEEKNSETKESNSTSKSEIDNNNTTKAKVEDINNTQKSEDMNSSNQKESNNSKVTTDSNTTKE